MWYTQCWEFPCKVRRHLSSIFVQDIAATHPTKDFLTYEIPKLVEKP